MTPERWERVRTVFFAALDTHPDLRGALLDRECRADDLLRDEIVSLLDSSERAKNFLTRPAAEIAAGWAGTDGVAPERLGAWQLRREIGRGGMATVYLCERADGQFEKRAAVKILRLGLHGDDDVLTRFARERQLLADLDHPHIVRLLDGGVTGDGRPYLVMDFVDGAPISTYVTEQQPSTAQRLTLFLKVCDAVSYAHSLSIIHRDIKPGNILVTPDGAPKLLDFGIAKFSMAADGTGATDVTRSASRYFTLEYASPEQVRGEAVAAASDVYSLGLVLCQILTGRAPFDLRGLQPYEAARAVCEDSPDFGGVPPGLAKIVRKATQKAPQQRYPAVEVFARDLRQYLESPERQESRAALLRRVLYTIAVLIVVLTAALAFRGRERPGRNGAGAIFSNGVPADIPGSNITALRVADDFILKAPTRIQSLEFWFGPGNGNPVSDFSGTVTYAFYNNAAGAIGSLIASGTVSGLVPIPTGRTLSICDHPPHCPIQGAQFNLVAPVPLVAGTYWLELHEGTTLTSDDRTRTAWAASAQPGNAKQGPRGTVPTAGINREMAFRLFDTAIP
jgi:serine/threonine protein kinase